MKTQFIALSMLLLMLGCSSSSAVAPTTYLLNDGKQQNASYKSNQPILLVQPVLLNEFLSNKGIAYFVSETEVINAQQHLWGKNLSQQITEQLTHQLRKNNVPYWPMTTTNPINNTNYPKLQINIWRFDGNYQGNATLAGEWVLVDKNGNMRASQTFIYQEPLATEGYQALVDGLSKTVNTLAQDLATKLKIK